MIDVLFSSLTKILSWLLTPIDNILVENIPSFELLLSYINNFLSYILNYIVWALSWMPIDYTVISIMIDIFISYFTITALLRPLNLLLSWIKEVRT